MVDSVTTKDIQRRNSFSETAVVDRSAPTYPGGSTRWWALLGGISVAVVVLAIVMVAIFGN
jgi:hypothetical protein